MMTTITEVQLDASLLNETIVEALAAAAAHPARQRRIAEAANWLRRQPGLKIELIDGALVVLSSSSTRIYHSGAECQCEAYRHGLYCWHRAASDLVATTITCMRRQPRSGMRVAIELPAESTRQLAELLAWQHEWSEARFGHHSYVESPEALLIGLLPSLIAEHHAQALRARQYAQEEVCIAATDAKTTDQAPIAPNR